MNVDAARKRRRGVAMWLVGVVVAAILFVLFLGPGQFGVWKSQRSETRDLNAKIDALDQANERLQTRATQLRDPEAIRELARRDYGMVPKGSKAYAILPAPLPDDRPGGAWPFVELQFAPSDP